ncbi:DUF1428 family protein [Caulobacter segnis]
MEHGRAVVRRMRRRRRALWPADLFPRAVQTTEDETVIFSWITYKDRASRDEINAQGHGRRAAEGPHGRHAFRRQADDLRRLPGLPWRNSALRLYHPANDWPGGDIHPAHVSMPAALRLSLFPGCN